MKNKIKFIITYCFFPKNRLDQVLINIFPEYSRSNFKNWIISNKIIVNNIYVTKPNIKIYIGDKIIFFIKKIDKKVNLSEKIFLHVIYEDPYLLIINKPYGLVVHPGPGNETGTLLNALLYRNKLFHHLPRAGIVHRLDKNTTGLMIIAKDIVTYTTLKKLIQNKNIIRQYDAFVLGTLLFGGTINVPVLRNSKNRTCMITNNLGKSAVTHFKIVQKFKYYTHIKLQLETGRTHQIRVHMLHIKNPILGDPIYTLKGYFPKIPKNIFDKIKCFHRQALHASHIKFLHPITNILVDCYIQIPSDMVNIIKYL